MIHLRVLNVNILYGSAAPAACLQTDAPVRVGELTVGDCDIQDIIAGFTSDHNTAMPVKELAAGDVYVACGLQRCIHDRTGLERNTVIADIDQAVQNADILAAVRVDAICVGRVIGIVNGNMGNENIPAHTGVDSPGGGVDERYAFYGDMFAVFHPYKVWSGQGKRTCLEGGPPFLPLSVNASLASDMHITGVLRKQQRMINLGRTSAIHEMHGLSMGFIGKEAERTAAGQVQCNVIKEHNRTCQILTGGHLKRAAALCSESMHGSSERIGPVGSPPGQGCELLYIAHIDATSLREDGTITLIPVQEAVHGKSENLKTLHKNMMEYYGIIGPKKVKNNVILLTARIVWLTIRSDTLTERRVCMALPNVIFYFSDQQRWDTLGCYGQRLPVSPHLDALAQEGTLFTHAFTCQPVCGPARACLQSGLYATQVDCHKNHRILPENADTVAKRLNRAGYLTGYIGKWHLASNDEASYREKAVPPQRRGGYQYWMAADALEMTSHGYNGYVFDGDMQRHDFVGHRVDCINAYAIDFLHQYVHAQREGTEKRPFFLFVSQLDPHHQNDHNRYEGPDNSKHRFADYDVPPDLVGTKGDWRENFPDYLGQCHLLDDNIGKLMDTLEDCGLADNTIVLYSSDHGSHFRTRNAEYKRSCEDACLHVPLIAWGGPFMGGGKVEELVSLIDIPPTILELCGLQAPPAFQGNSLLKLLDERKAEWPDAVYAQISEAETGRTVRTQRYKYAVRAPEFHIEEPYASVYVENKLYDLQKDPGEWVNLIRDPAYETVREDMRGRLIQFMKKAEEPAAEILPAENDKENVP